MDKNDVLRQIAKPTPSLFQAIKKNVYNQLSNHFHQYTLTTEYKNLGIFLQDKRQEENRKETEAKKANRMFALPVSQHFITCYFSCFLDHSFSEKHVSESNKSCSCHDRSSTLSRSLFFLFLKWNENITLHMLIKKRRLEVFLIFRVALAIDHYLLDNFVKSLYHWKSGSKSIILSKT